MNAINHDRVCSALDHGERLIAEGKPRVVVMIPVERQLYAPLAIQLLSFPDAEEGSQFISHRSRADFVIAGFEIWEPLEKKGDLFLVEPACKRRRLYRAFLYKREPDMFLEYNSRGASDFLRGCDGQISFGVIL